MKRIFKSGNKYSKENYPPEAMKIDIAIRK